MNEIERDPVQKLLAAQSGSRSSRPAADGSMAGSAPMASFAVFDELAVGDDFESSIVVLDQGGEGLDPIATVEVVHVAELFVGRGVNVPANDAAVVVLAGQVLKLFLILIDKSNCRFDLGFHPTAEGAVG